jgi:Chloramphenicol 3-O-phosphotransferase
MTEPSEYQRLVRRVLLVPSRADLDDSGLVATAADTAVIARELEPLWRAPGLDITEFRVNGVRGDVRLRSDDGRAWLVVLWVDDSRPPKLVAATSYERPPEFRNDQAGCVVVLNGPSSVGKSSLMAAFADAATTPWACIDEPMFGRFADKFLAWPAAAGPATAGFLAALAAAARLGNQFIVSSGGIAQDRFREVLSEMPAFYVGLQAPLAVLLERQVTQADKFGGLAEESVGIHAGWKYDLTIDMSSCSPSEAARALAELVADEFSGRPRSV